MTSELKLQTNTMFLKLSILKTQFDHESTNDSSKDLTIGLR